MRFHDIYNADKTWFRYQPTRMAMALVFGLAAALSGTPLYAQESLSKSFPFLIMCKTKTAHNAFYLSSIDAEGRATYLTMSAEKLAGTITRDGVAEPVGMGVTGNCAGKTLEQLRTDGQAFDLPK